MIVVAKQESERRMQVSGRFRLWNLMRERKRQVSVSIQRKKYQKGRKMQAFVPTRQKWLQQVSQTGSEYSVDCSKVVMAKELSQIVTVLSQLMVLQFQKVVEWRLQMRYLKMPQADQN